ncbi:MAG TPA: hypothetical protein VMT47_08600 [Polyangia bacterium]|nr:hypothetical protein [Polyangia bacterium]
MDIRTSDVNGASVITALARRQRAIASAIRENPKPLVAGAVVTALGVSGLLIWRRARGRHVRRPSAVARLAGAAAAAFAAIAARRMVVGLFSRGGF